VANSYGATWEAGAQGTSLAEQGVAFVFAENTRKSVDAAVAEIGRHPAVTAAMRQTWFDHGATRYVNGMANVGAHEVGHLMGLGHVDAKHSTYHGSVSPPRSAGVITFTQYNIMAGADSQSGARNPMTSFMLTSRINRFP
jgi:hypothetical protein